jgi:hypothetical protein
MDDDGDHGEDEQNVDCESGDVIEDEAADPHEHQKESKQQPYESHLSPRNLPKHYAARLRLAIEQNH